MKKIILTALFLAAFTSSAFAAAVISAQTTIGSLIFSPSNSVYVSVDSAIAGYEAESLHKSGSRVFATDSVESKLYWKDVSISATAPKESFDTLGAPTTSGTHGTLGLPSGFVAL